MWDFGRAPNHPLHLLHKNSCLRLVKVAGCWYLITIFWSKFATTCTKLWLLQSEVSKSLMLLVSMSQKVQSDPPHLPPSLLIYRCRWSRFFNATSVQCDSTQHHRNPRVLPVCCAILCDSDCEDSVSEVFQNKADSGHQRNIKQQKPKDFRLQKSLPPANCTESAKINQDETDSCWLFESFF